MAVLTLTTNQAAANLGGRKLPSYNDQARTFVQEFNLPTVAVAGDIGTTIRLFKIPPGIYRFHRQPSFVTASAFGAARTLDIGWEAYVDKDGTAVAVSAAGLNSAIDVSAATITTPTKLGVALATEYKDFESRDGVWIYATLAGGTIPTTATLTGAAHFSV